MLVCRCLLGQAESENESDRSLPQPLAVRSIRRFGVDPTWDRVGKCDRLHAKRPKVSQISPHEVGANGWAVVPRRRWRRWIGIGALAAVLVLFYFYVTFRGPREFTGELARLLPARTSAFVALNNFDAIRKRIGQTRLYDQISNSVDLAALLMTSEDWRKYQENKDSIEWKAKTALAREFLRRYFSREVVVALSRLDGCDEPTLLVMARTDLGFAEKLGELCAQLYPELRLSGERYRGIPFYAYEAPQSKRSFTYVRFGKTVVLSLRSNERDYLRRIIDWRLDAPAETLFGTGEFQRAWRSPARRQGLLAVARPSVLLKDLVARPEFNLRNYFNEPRRAPIRSALSAFRFAEAAVTVTNRLEIQLEARNDEATSRSSPTVPPVAPLTLLETVPSSCTAFAVFRFENLPEMLAKIFNIHRAFSEQAADPRALTEAVEQITAQWGADVIGNLSEALGHETALVIHNVQLPMMVVASLLFPIVDRTRAQSTIGRLIKRYADFYADANHARDVPREFRDVPDFHPLYSTPLGFLGVGWLGDYVLCGTSPNSYLMMKQMIASKGKPITRDPAFQSLGLPIGEPLDAVAFVNLEEVGRRAEGLLAVVALFSKNVRKKSVMYGKIIGVVKLVRCVGLSARHGGGDWTFVLRVPIQ